MNFKKYQLELIVFLCGAIVMIFELVGARLLGPYFGTSIFVWTNIIGVILASLSLGYYLGGKVADRKPTLSNLSLIIFLSGLFMTFTFFIKESFLEFLYSNLNNIKFSSFLASVILFSPSSILLGMISPYAAKLKLSDLKHSGATVGALYALSTAGSIFGTFVSGFLLIPFFGTNKLLMILSALLILISMFAYSGSFKFKSATLVVILGAVLGTSWMERAAQAQGFIDLDTPYNRVWIKDIPHPQTGEPIRSLFINNENSSAMFLNREDLVYEYTKYYHLARHFKPDFKTALMLGGAAYSYPKDFLKTYPEARLDVVEIDPEMTRVAKDYFHLKDDPRLTVYHEDGRVYLNQAKKKYDVIFGDAFSSQHSLPYQLTTRETVQRKYDLLEDDGVVVLNIISSIEGEKGQFLRAEYATYQAVFPQVYLFPVTAPTDGERLQNIMLVALKGEGLPDFESDDRELSGFLSHRWMQPVPQDLPVLTDDYAPVEHYIGKTIH